MRLPNPGRRVAPLLYAFALYLAVMLWGALHADAAGAAACDPTLTSCHIYGTTSPALGTISSITSIRAAGAKFTTSSAVSVASFHWYRANATAVAPTAVRVWQVGTGAAVNFGASGATYTDLTPFTDTTVGWKDVPIPDTLRPALAAGGQYVAALEFPAGTVYRAGSGSPVADGPLTFNGNVNGSTAGVMPATGGSTYYLVDIGVIAAPATPTPTPSPSPTPTVGPTSTPTPSPTVGPTSTPLPSPTSTPAPTATPAPICADGGAYPTKLSLGCENEVHIYRRATYWSASDFGLDAGSGQRAQLRMVLIQQPESTSTTLALRTWLQCGSEQPMFTGLTGPESHSKTELAFVGSSNYNSTTTRGGTLPVGGLDPASNFTCRDGPYTVDARWPTGLNTVVYWPSTGKCYYWSSADLDELTPDGLCVSSELVSAEPPPAPTPIAGLACRGTPGDPCYVRAPIIETRLSEIVAAINAVGGAITGLPAALAEAAAQALIPSPTYLTDRVTGLQGQWDAKLPIKGQVDALQGQLEGALVAPGACEDAGGLVLEVHVAGASGTLDALDELFRTIWCPWRPIVGALAVLASGFAAVRAGIRIVEAHR